MQGPFGELILKIQEQLKAEVSEIREVLEDKGQIDAYDLKPAVSLPCVLIDFDFTFDDMGMNTQMGDGEVVIRLAFPPYSSSSSLMPVSVREKGMAYLDYELKIYRALHGWQPVSDPAVDGYSFGALMRRSAKTEKRSDPMRVREIRFATSIEDATAQDQRTTQLIAGKEITAEITAERPVDPS